MGIYRPFAKTGLYADLPWIHRPGVLAWAFPALLIPNHGFTITGIASHHPFSLICTDAVPDQHLLDTGQFFARWRYEKVEVEDGTFDILSTSNEGGAEVIDGYRRIDNITDHALGLFRDAYGERITKDDVFFYVYGLLHSPDYRETYAADLKKMLPRVPLVTDPWPYVDAGRQLSELHLSYETVDPYPLDGLDAQPPAGTDPYAFYSVGTKRMAFGKPTSEQRAAGEKKDRTAIGYNSHITLRGIPEEAYRYQLGARSAIEWIIDRYHVKTDKASGIVNDPNDWSREVGDSRYILDLLARIVTVSLETMKVVDALPPLDVKEAE